jgi:hypothetical protein
VTGARRTRSRRLVRAGSLIRGSGQQVALPVGMMLAYAGSPAPVLCGKPGTRLVPNLALSTLKPGIRHGMALINDSGPGTGAVHLDHPGYLPCGLQVARKRELAAVPRWSARTRNACLYRRATISSPIRAVIEVRGELPSTWAVTVTTASLAGQIMQS